MLSELGWTGLIASDFARVHAVRALFSFHGGITEVFIIVDGTWISEIQYTVSL